VFVVTLVLGFSITRAARGHLLEARAAMVTVAVEDLPPFPTGGEGSRAEFAAFDVAVRVKVLGGENGRVKVFAPDGTSRGHVPRERPRLHRSCLFDPGALRGWHGG